MAAHLLEMFGGVRTQLVSATPDNPSGELWNFGVAPKTDEVENMIRARPSLHAKYPKMAGKWDGKTTVNSFKAAQAVLGDKALDLIQQQPRGTCGGRAGSGSSDLVQCVLIQSGRRVKTFHRSSHAFLYWQARKKYGMAKGSPSDENNDGVASGSIPEVLTQIGQVNRDESGDLNAYGGGSDALATQWGCGRIDSALAQKLEAAAKDNIITDWAPVTSFQEMADGIASGGVALGSDGQGFTMTRDKDGFCRPSGTWQHYQVRCSVGTYGAAQRKGCGYWQSWGKDAPQGPYLADHPGNCFGVDAEVQDMIIKSGEWAVVFGFEPWELEAANYDITWLI